MVGDTEMTTDDMTTVPDQYGGVLQLAFLSGGMANLITGTGVTEGTYSIASDESYIITTVGDYNHISVFIADPDGEENPMMVLVEAKTKATALYFTYISEH